MARWSERARRKLDQAGIRNARFVPGNACRLPFPDAEFDAAFLVAVLGEVPDRAACLRETCRVLKPGALLSVTEQRPDPDFIAREELDALVPDTGFEFVEAWGPPRGYTANFRKPT